MLLQNVTMETIFIRWVIFIDFNIFYYFLIQFDKLLYLEISKLKESLIIFWIICFYYFVFLIRTADKDNCIMFIYKNYQQKTKPWPPEGRVY